MKIYRYCNPIDTEFVSTLAVNVIIALRTCLEVIANSKNRTKSDNEVCLSFALKCFELSDNVLKNQTKSVSSSGKLIDLSCVTVMLAASSMLDSHFIINSVEVRFSVDVVVFIVKS